MPLRTPTHLQGSPAPQRGQIPLSVPLIEHGTIFGKAFTSGSWVIPPGSGLVVSSLLIPKQDPGRLLNLPKVAWDVSGKRQIRSSNPCVPGPEPGSVVSPSPPSTAWAKPGLHPRKPGGWLGCCGGHRQAHTHKQRPAGSFSAPSDSNTPVLEQTEKGLKSLQPRTAGALPSPLPESASKI